MKILLVATLLFIFGIYRAFGQDLEFSAKIDTLNTKSKTINITVQITGGQPNYVVYLMDNVPYQGGKIITYGKRLESDKYFFSEIKISSFYVCVQDEKKALSCKKNSKLLPINQ